MRVPSFRELTSMCATQSSATHLLRGFHGGSSRPLISSQAPESFYGKLCPLFSKIRLHLLAVAALGPWLVIQTPCKEACNMHKLPNEAEFSLEGNNVD